MGWVREIDVRVPINATPEAVWDRVSNHENTTSWVRRGLRKVTITKPGDPAPGGLDAIRSVKFVGWPAVLERVVHYEAGRSFHYKVFARMPHLADHLGKVTVSPTDSGAELRWHIMFDFKPWHPLSWSAPLFVRTFRGVVRSGCEELKRQLE